MSMKSFLVCIDWSLANLDVIPKITMCQIKAVAYILPLPANYGERDSDDGYQEDTEKSGKEVHDSS